MTGGVVVAGLVVGIFALVFIAGSTFLFVLQRRVLPCAVCVCVGVVIGFYLVLLSLFCLVLWLSCRVMLFSCCRIAL